MAATAPKPEGSELPPKLLAEARRLHVAIAGRSQTEVETAVREAWQEENREAIEGINAWVEKNGLPLDRYRAF
ncbi:MAG TPA: type II toxin-antitoxin system CcdA family antitoxin [Allosphingosinicella sp.]|jgi:antitoxin CcdA